MAVAYKNIVITPNIGNTAEPTIAFSGANSSANTDVKLRVLPDDGGIVSFEKGDNTALLQISSNNKIYIANNAKLIANGSAGSSGDVLSSNGTGVYWTALTDLNTTYAISALSTTGGANVRLTDSNNANDDVKFAGSGSVSVTASGDTITITGTDNNTTYDHLAISGTGYANLRLHSSADANDDVKFVGSGGTTVAYTDADTITISSTDNNTTYTVDSAANTTSANVILVPSSGSNSQIKLVGSGATGVSSDGDTITITSTDNNTTYTQSAVSGSGYANVRLTSSADANDDIKFQGTGGIVVAQVDGDTVNVAINAAASYTWSNAHTFNANLTANDVVINGNLTVSGTTTYVNSTTLNIGDNIVTLNADIGATAPTQDAGIEVHRGTSTNATFLWSETDDNWQAYDGTNTIAIKAGNSTIIANSSGIFANAAAIDTNTTYTVDSAANTSSANVILIPSSGTNSEIKIVGSGATGVSSDGDTITISSTDNNTTYAISALSTTGGANVRLTDSSNSNDDVKFAGSGTVSVTASGDTITITGTATSPSGSNTYIQYNDSGSFGSEANFTYDKDTDTMSIGANTKISTTSVFLGNSTVNTVISQTTASFNANSSMTAMYVAANGNIGVSTTTPEYNLQVNGSFAAVTKSFLIDHPLKKGWKLRYGSLESPYHGIRLTGMGEIKNGKVKIDLPKYVKNLVHNDENAQVQLTNYQHGKILWVDSIDTDKNNFVVKMDRQKGDKEVYKFFWSFTAIRKDIDDMIVEFEEE